MTDEVKGVEKKVADTIAYYDSHSSEYANKIEPLAPIPEIEKFSVLVKDSGKVLDVGCGPGRDSRHLHKRGFQVIGTDISKGLLSEARRRSPDSIEFRKMDVRDLKFPDNSFDGIYASAVLLHLPTITDVKKALKEFYRVLRSKGIVHIRVKAQKSDKETEVVKEELSGGNPRFFRYFTEEGLTQLVKDAGFSVKEHYTYNNKDKDKSHRDLDWVVLFAEK